jgi:predicted transcriptional regulator
MPCVLPDGTVAPVAKRILSMASKERSAEEIADETGVPLFRVRSSIRELLEAGLLEDRGERYRITEKGKEKI